MGYLDGFRVTFAKTLGGFGLSRTESAQVITKQYVKGEGDKRPKPERFHGRHVLNRYEDGMEKCIGCELCAGVCPARCIYVRGKDNDPADPVSPGERYGFVYEINYLRCIHCDLCVEACPTEAITESKLFEFSFTNRQDAIYTKAELVVDDDGLPQQLPWEDWTDADDIVPMTSGWMRATAPSGDADFVGVVAWAGELGFGVREAEAGESADADPAAELIDSDHDDDDGHGHGGRSLMETFVFIVAGACCIAGALGVVLARNPVHSALALVGTLFGIAVLFINQEAHFLAAVQVIVYAGAIVVLFLFVIMLLGVDRDEDIGVEPIVGQRIAALVMGAAVLALPIAALASTDWEATGERSNLAPVSSAADPAPGAAETDIEGLGEVLFTRYVFAFEATSVLLVIAVVGAVVMARKSRRADEIPIDAEPDDEPETEPATGATS